GHQSARGMPDQRMRLLSLNAAAKATRRVNSIRSSLLRVALLPWLTACAAFAADWPQFLGPNGDGTSPETELIDRIPAGGLPIVWSADIGTGYGAPSVLDGQLVLHHRRGDA